MTRTVISQLTFLLSLSLVLLIPSCDAVTTATPTHINTPTPTKTSTPTPIPTSTPTPTVCTDIAPAGTTCLQLIGPACSTLIAQGKCLISCGACTAQPNTDATSFPNPPTNTTCNDVVPPPQPFIPALTCAQYFAAGSCGLSFMQGFCRLTCGNCTLPTPAPLAISSAPPMMMMSDAPALVLVGAIVIITVIALIVAGVFCYIWHQRRVSDVTMRVRGMGLLSQRSNQNLLSSNSITPEPAIRV